MFSDYIKHNNTDNVLIEAAALVAATTETGLEVNADETKYRVMS
jgi:hypothetical protein